MTHKMIFHFKECISEKTVKINQIHKLLPHEKFNDFDTSTATNLEVQQMEIHIQNVITKKSFFDLEKIFFESDVKFPKEYFDLFVSSNFPDYLINFMMDFSSHNFQIISVAILNNITFSNPDFILLPNIICNPEIVFQFLQAPEIREGQKSSYACLSLVFTILLSNTLMKSQELTSIFITNGLFQRFVQMFLDPENKNTMHITYWSKLIPYFSSPKFPIDIKEKISLLQAYCVMYDLKLYKEYINSIDNLLDNEGEEVFQYIFKTDIFTNNIYIIIINQEKTDLDSIELRKNAMFLLTKMIINDKNNELNLTFLPMDIFSDFLNSPNVSDQIASLKIMIFYIKKKENEAIQELIEKGVYNKFNDLELTYSSKDLYLNLFLTTALITNDEQMETLVQYGMYQNIFECADTSNEKIINKIVKLVVHLMENENYVRYILLPNEILLNQLADELNDENGNIMKSICTRLQDFGELNSL
ncbi:hypothetical protein TRFO_10698 [Tritrichomonas foetus]|uniref:Uncharacterized protein n=1 Tax=Tritrichomonas foetus TaxID=1144522 RepID=A0A1J4JC66_9EUKA|nr:hypothetical protein TRFO_10698 [Tritrichomonas foetus]|eukprot:OHS95005.1 hypothetical protein TRFO_10698 [Tritrichomonas foetus]